MVQKRTRLECPEARQTFPNLFLFAVEEYSRRDFSAHFFLSNSSQVIVDFCFSVLLILLKCCYKLQSIDRYVKKLT